MMSTKIYRQRLLKGASPGDWKLQKITPTGKPIGVINKKGGYLLIACYGFCSNERILDVKHVIS